MSDSGDLKRGLNTIKQKGTWQKVGALALDSLAGSIGIMLSNKLTANSSRTFQYGIGTGTSGLIAVCCFAMNFENAGFGAASATAAQALNFTTTLILDKSIAELAS
jgi:D-arabinose 5-phosphate isomerase GutQ